MKADTLAERDQQLREAQGISDESPMRLRMEKFVKEQQKEIVKALEELDGTKFRVDEWTRKEGGGRRRQSRCRNAISISMRHARDKRKRKKRNRLLVAGARMTTNAPLTRP